MDRWINYHHLFYFKVIADKGSFSKASEALKVSQPSLSAQIKNLEGYLNVRLFQRTAKGLKLTGDGKRAYEFAREIFRMGSDLYYSFHNSENLGSPKRIVVGTVGCVPRQVLSSIGKQILENHNCLLTFTHRRPVELISQLDNSEVDLVITNTIPFVEGEKKYRIRTLRKDPVGIYGSKDFLKLRKNFIQNIVGQLFLVPSIDSKLRIDFNKWLQGVTPDHRNFLEAEDIATRKHLAVDSVGLLPVPRFAVTRQVLEGGLFELFCIPDVFDSLYLVTHETQYKPEVGALFSKLKV